MQWLVRSQDRKFIIPFETVEVVTVSGRHIVRGSGRILGEYASEARCIEVVDDIQNFIDGSNRFLIANENDISAEDYDELLNSIEKNRVTWVGRAENAKVIPLNTTSIYEMPKE